MFPLVTKTLEALRGKSDQDIGMIAAAAAGDPITMPNELHSSSSSIHSTLNLVIFKAALKGSSSDIH